MNNGQRTHENEDTPILFPPIFLHDDIYPPIFYHADIFYVVIFAGRYSHQIAGSFHRSRAKHGATTFK
jgi:hypothetical protein